MSGGITRRELERLRFVNPGPANEDIPPSRKSAAPPKAAAITATSATTTAAAAKARSSPMRRRRNQNRAARPTHPPNAFHDDQGRILVNGADLCDCLSATCPGCYYPCPKCCSTRCGIECRIRRKWAVDNIRVNDTSQEVSSPYLDLIHLPLFKQHERRLTMQTAK